MYKFILWGASSDWCLSLNLEQLPSLQGLKRWWGEGRRGVGDCRLLRGYLGDRGAAVGKEAEFLGELKGEVGERRRGLASRSPLCSFHSSSSFSMDRRLLTLDSFCSVCWRMACSVDSCLQGETYRRLWQAAALWLERKAYAHLVFQAASINYSKFCLLQVWRRREAEEHQVTR